MKIYNKSKRAYQHDKYFIKAGENLEVPDEVAKILIATGDIVEYVEPKEAKAKEDALKAENEKLKAELATLKKEAKAKEDALKAENEAKKEKK